MRAFGGVFGAQIEAKETLRTRRSPNVFMGFVVAFVVALLLLRLKLSPTV